MSDALSTHSFGRIEPERLLDTHLARALFAAQKERRSGVLTIDEGELTIHVHLTDGVVTYVDRGALAETLGRLLMRQGVIDRDEYGLILEQMAEPAEGEAEVRRFGDVAIQLGMLTEEELEDALRMQVAEKLQHVLTLDQGYWRFDGALPPVASRFPIAFEPTLRTALMEDPQSYRWPGLLVAKRTRRMRLKGEPDAIAARFALTEEEQRVVRAMDGRPLADLLASRVLPPEEAGVIVALLLFAELLDLEAPASQRLDQQETADLRRRLRQRAQDGGTEEMDAVSIAVEVREVHEAILEQERAEARALAEAEALTRAEAEAKRAGEAAAARIREEYDARRREKEAAEAARRRAAEEAKARAEAEARAQAEARARAEAEARKRAELEARAAADAEARKRAELEARAAADARARAELKARAKAEQEARARAEHEARARAEAEARAKAEAEARAKAEQEARARAEAEVRARAKAAEEAKARQLAEAKAAVEAKAAGAARAAAEAKAAALAKAAAEAERTIQRRPAESARDAAERLRAEMERRSATKGKPPDDARPRLDAERLFEEGRRALGANALEKARDAFEKAVVLMPDAAEYRLHLAWARYLATEDDVHRRVFENELRTAVLEALQQDRRMGFAHYVQGRLFLVDEDLAGAERAFKNASRLDKSHVDSQRYLRLVQRRLGR